MLRTSISKIHFYLSIYMSLFIQVSACHQFHVDYVFFLIECFLSLHIDHIFLISNLLAINSFLMIFFFHSVFLQFHEPFSHLDYTDPPLVILFQEYSWHPSWKFLLLALVNVRTSQDFHLFANQISLFLNALQRGGAQQTAVFNLFLIHLIHEGLPCPFLCPWF